MNGTRAGHGVQVSDLAPLCTQFLRAGEGWGEQLKLYSPFAPLRGSKEKFSGSANMSCVYVNNVLQMGHEDPHAQARCGAGRMAESGSRTPWPHQIGHRAGCHPSAAKRKKE